LATSNTLAAVLGGASVAHVTVNGLGERAGNTALGEVALGAKLLLGLDVKIKLDELYKLSKIVSEISGFPVSPNKPIVGENVFNIESAQSAQWLATTEEGGYSLAYPFSKEIIGHPEQKVLLSKKSGPYNLRLKLAELGLNVPEEKFPEVLGIIYEKSLQKKGALTDDEFLEVLEDLGLYKYKQEDLMRG
jgi:isopropylmalate/homocitrate/citramalate synthase